MLHGYIEHKCNDAAGALRHTNKSLKGMTRRQQSSEVHISMLLSTLKVELIDVE